MAIWDGRGNPEVDGTTWGNLVIDDELFADVWARPQLIPRDRSLITCATLITGGRTDQLLARLTLLLSRLNA